ncbi:hypothetical protein M0R45_035790 [Rubus argutus]|uniref:Wall-associated receptor kinase galacturonan-binding domain-containing protein n=1 Tax=Rubus argutus TaxID=59490 RepID=A0AAW1VVP4_RUBAR
MGSIKSFMILCWWVYNLVAFDLVDAKVGRSDCVPSSCGHIPEISYPFRLKHDPKHCGESAYTLSCDNNVTVLDLSSGKFYVQEINYTSQTIWVVDASIQNNNGSSIPSYSLTNWDMYPSPYYVDDNWSSSNVATLGCILPQNKSAGSTCRGTYSIYFLKCRNPVNSSVYVDTSPCFKSQPNSHGYVKVNGMEVGELKDGCNVERMSFVYLSDEWDASCTYIQTALLYGFEMTYSNLSCERQWSINYKCYPKSFTGFFRFLWVVISSRHLYPNFSFCLLYASYARINILAKTPDIV